MKILVLDFDGVLNSLRSAMAFGNYPHRLPQDLALFDPVALGIVRRLCAETGAVVVISSTWRRSHARVVIAEALGLEVVGCTPAYNACGVKRGDEIQQWLDSHAQQVEKYCILDDDSDMLEHQMPFFVKCDGEVGVSAQNYKDALSILGKIP
jgi:hypothetical protein